MKSRLFITLLTFHFCLQATAQNKAYFQQEVNYRIDVKLDDQAKMLRAFESFEYINHSPDTLKTLILHCWPNAYRDRHSALAHQEAEEGKYSLYHLDPKDQGFIDSMNYKVDGVSVGYKSYGGHHDIIQISLPKPLLPGGKITVTTPFRVKIPNGSISRLGFVKESFQITQWYPKPAVYDSQGWHPLPYLNQGEFYSEFGSFDVSITLPKNYIIGSTGDCQTPSEVEWMNKLSQLENTSNGEDWPESSSEWKTVRYTQSRVHDFGWFADKRWIVRKGFIVLPYSKDTVTTWALFTPRNAELWESAGLQAIHDGLYYYSQWAGDYPYKQCTAVDGTISAGGGMEYPNVTVIGNMPNVHALSEVIIHEVGHNWFYGILGSNERDHGWMDEGLNSFFETRTVLAVNPGIDGASAFPLGGIEKFLHLNRLSYQFVGEELPYLLLARLDADQPIDLPSACYSSMNYGSVMYKKTSLVMNYLMQYLGEEAMNQCFRNYFNEWKFRHPQPSDIQASFEKTTGKDLSWLFEEIIPTKRRVDFKIGRVKFTDNGARVRVVNKGETSGPFCLDVIRDGEKINRFWYDPIEPFDSRKVELQGVQKGDMLVVNNASGIPEFDRRNNYTRTKGIFKKIEPLHLMPLTNIDKPQSNDIFYLPLVAWNSNDHWMAGLWLHNKTVPNRKIEWSVAPLYSFSNATLNGFASLIIRTHNIQWGARTQSFGYQFPSIFSQYNYTSLTADGSRAFAPRNIYESGPLRKYFVIKPFINVKLFRSKHAKRLDVDLNLEGVFVQNGITPQDMIGSGWSTYFHPKLMLRGSYLRSTYSLENESFLGDAVGTTNITTASFSWLYLTGKRKKSLYIKLSGSPRTNKSLFLPLGGQTSQFDYAYDQLYLGRLYPQGFLSRQINNNWASLIFPGRFMITNNFVVANAEIDIPYLPLAVYGAAANFTTSPTWDFFNTVKGGNFNVWDAGVSLKIAKGLFQIWLPLAYSSELKNALSADERKPANMLMFQLNLDAMNPFKVFEKSIR